jgi:hypothetical protein
MREHPIPDDTSGQRRKSILWAEQLISLSQELPLVCTHHLFISK